jgi:hypothetical protein
MNNKYIPGEVVYEKKPPFRKLIVRAFFPGYYCHVADEPNTSAMVYFEREISDEPPLLVQDIKDLPLATP